MDTGKVLGLRWHVKLNDLIGGWAIGTEAGPMREHGVDENGVLHGGVVVADFIPVWELADHIVRQHNTWLGLDSPEIRVAFTEVGRD